MAAVSAPVAFDFARRSPSPRMAGLIVGITGYREAVAGRYSRRQTAPLIAPLIVSFGTPFLIALAREPGASDRQRRFDLIEDFVLRRANHAPSPEIAAAYRRLARSAGTVRITTLAAEIGWSRKHLVDRFRSELGLAPKSLARMMRFHQACRIAQRGGPRAWAAIAAESGYSDQAHLVREFVEFAGEPPTAWARRLAMTDSRLAHSGDLLADR